MRQHHPIDVIRCKVGVGLRLRCNGCWAKKTLENEILREALDLAQPKKRLLLGPSPARDDTP